MAAPSTVDSSVEETEEVSYGIYWESRLEVYKQPLVWISDVLTTKQRNHVLNCVAVFAVTNCIIMFLSAFPMPLLLLCGIVLLLLSAGLSICLLINISSTLRPYPNWGMIEEGRYKNVCLYVGTIHCKVNQLVTSVFLLRKEDPKKFYGVGILLSFIFSHLGHLISTPVFLHITINSILLVPLIVHYELHAHLMSNEFIHSLWAKMKRQ